MDETKTFKKLDVGVRVKLKKDVYPAKAGKTGTILVAASYDSRSRTTCWVVAYDHSPQISEVQPRYIFHEVIHENFLEILENQNG